MLSSLMPLRQSAREFAFPFQGISSLFSCYDLFLSVGTMAPSATPRCLHHPPHHLHLCICHYKLHVLFIKYISYGFGVNASFSFLLKPN